MSFDFAALNALRHHRRSNRAEVHVAAAGSSEAQSTVINRVIHKGVGMVVAATAGAIDSGGLWKGGMPEIGSKGSGVGLDVLGGLGLSVFELIAIWRGMHLGYAAPVVSGGGDGLLFYWSGKQGQLWGAAKKLKDAAPATKGAAQGQGAATGFDYALPDGRRSQVQTPQAVGQTAGFAYDPLHGFSAQ
jgi:hypothetical protein